VPKYGYCVYAARLASSFLLAFRLSCLIRALPEFTLSICVSIALHLTLSFFFTSSSLTGCSMTFVVLLPAGGTPVCPFDQSYDKALRISAWSGSKFLAAHYARISWLWLNAVDTIGTPHCGGLASGSPLFSSFAVKAVSHLHLPLRMTGMVHLRLSFVLAIPSQNVKLPSPPAVQNVP